MEETPCRAACRLRNGETENEMKTTLIACAFALALLTGCVTPPPTEQQIASASLGPPPANPEPAIKAYLSHVLKDPDSLRLRAEPTRRGWYRASARGENRFGWVVACSVNAKNSFGGYGGEEPWMFFFLREQVVAVVWPGMVLREMSGGGLTAGQANVAAPPR